MTRRTMLRDRAARPNGIRQQAARPQVARPVPVTPLDVRARQLARELTVAVAVGNADAGLRLAVEAHANEELCQRVLYYLARAAGGRPDLAWPDA